MNIFKLDANLVGRDDGFARFPTSVRADDFSTQTDIICSNSKFRAESQIDFNLQFEDRFRRLVPTANDKPSNQCLRLRVECIQ